MFDATALEVMFSSPNDAGKEKDAFDEAIKEWNDRNALPFRKVLLPTNWMSNVRPLAGSAQDIINRMIVNRCDILVSVFKKKLGTQTEKYQSGTAEEIDRARIQGKAVMVYFCGDRPDEDNWGDEYRRLENYRKEVGKYFLYDTFSGSDFKVKFKDHLAQHMSESYRSYGRPPEYNQLSAQAREILVDSLPYDGKIIKKRGGPFVYFCSGDKVKHGGRDREKEGVLRAMSELIRHGIVTEVTKDKIYQVTALGKSYYPVF